MLLRTCAGGGQDTVLVPGASSGILQVMEGVAPPEFGVCAAADVPYLSTGGARAATVLAADAAFAHVLADRTAVIPRVPLNQPGEFYRRELPPLHAVLDDVSELSLLVVDGYADLNPTGRPGLRAYAHAEFGIPVIGVAKSRFRTATHAVPVVRGSSVRPLFITAAGMPSSLGGLFSQVLRLLAAEGMVSLGLLSLDGTKLAGNAVQKANRTPP